VTGMTMVAGINAALLNRERTGRGGLVATSLLRTGMYCMGWDIGIHLRFGRLQSTRPRSRQPAPLVNCYRAGDGRGFWLLGLEQDRHWPGLLAALGRADLGADPRYGRASDRATHCEALVAVLDEEFARLPLSVWAERFDAHDVWWAPINTVAQVIEDPQAIAAGAFVDMPLVDGEPPYRAVATPVDFGEDALHIGAVPGLGQHTAEVLRELGYSDSEIAELLPD
jgi:crotonobetainyl-CoA:carnitine CoA-transferase CaiB-like acyl-CoA transferase